MKTFITLILYFFSLSLIAADIPGVIILDDKSNSKFDEILIDEIKKSLQFDNNRNKKISVCKTYSSEKGINDIINYLDNIKNFQESDLRVLLLNYGSSLIKKSKSGKNKVDSIAFSENLDLIIQKANSLNLEILCYNLPYSENSELNKIHQQLNAIALEILDKYKINHIDYYGFSKNTQGDNLAFAQYLSESFSQWWTASARSNKSIKRIRLWEDNPPFYEYKGEEFINSLARVDNVSVPELELFLPDARYPKATVIFLPGGAYQFLGFLRNARELAEILNPYGIAVVGLKYRTKRNPEVTLCDAQRIVRYVRTHAKELGVSSDLVGVLGQSAGAHLTLNLSCNYTDGDPTSIDIVERESSRPDFIGVFSSWNFGANESDFIFKDDIPPVFIRHAKDDPWFELGQKLTLEIAEKSNHVNVRFLEKGGHGAFEIKNGNTGKDWTDEFIRWLNSLSN